MQKQHHQERRHSAPCYGREQPGMRPCNRRSFHDDHCSCWRPSVFLVMHHPPKRPNGSASLAWGRALALDEDACWTTPDPDVARFVFLSEVAVQNLKHGWAGFIRDFPQLPCTCFVLLRLRSHMRQRLLGTCISNWTTSITRCCNASKESIHGLVEGADR
jgi:hypothetical protein